MGGSESKSRKIKGDILLSFDSSKIVPGQPLQGTIIVNLKNDCPPAKLQIEILG
jgi:hypothetical protein